MLRFSILFISFFAILKVNAQISPCPAFDSIRVVVIGSSTASGTGASVPDSAWVNRYRNYLVSGRKQTNFIKCILVHDKNIIH